MAEYSILDTIHEPADLRTLKGDALPAICCEIRDFLISNVSKTGGHLASNLGVVELTVAAHLTFPNPEDCILFDVGHQCYVHKLLTGRRDRFPTLRTYGGMSGFLRPDESPRDCFVTGHASNSISAGLGILRGKRLQNAPGHVICIIGDGAMTGGLAYEALNDAGQSGQPLIVIFNDNEMSIGPNVGALANRLSKIRLKPRYFRAKSRTKAWFKRFAWGGKAIGGISAAKRRLRTTVLKESLFELMGFDYLGPADGHNVSMIAALLEEAAQRSRPVVIHLKTIKGKGYPPSEERPDEYHGVSAFDPAAGAKRLAAESGSFTDVFGAKITAMAKENDKICAITAAMEYNTGLTPFAKAYPNRFFDVGIAEGHAVTMAGGLAAAGMRPVVAVYSTFLQRGFDQLIHDIAIQRNRVIFAVDRGGIVGADGQTHQGVFDVGFLLAVPGMTVYAPSSYREQERSLELALGCSGPCALRYPRGRQGVFSDNTFDTPTVALRAGSHVTLVSYGIMINEVIEASILMERKGISAEIIKINRLSQTDIDPIAQSVQKTRRLVIVEDCIAKGSMGELVSSQLGQKGIACQIRLLNLGADFIPEGTVQEIYAAWGIDAGGIISAVCSMMEGKI